MLRCTAGMLWIRTLSVFAGVQHSVMTLKWLHVGLLSIQLHELAVQPPDNPAAAAMPPDPQQSISSQSCCRSVDTSDAATYKANWHRIKASYCYPLPPSIAAKCAVGLSLLSFTAACRHVHRASRVSEGKLSPNLYDPGQQAALYLFDLCHRSSAQCRAQQATTACL